MRRLSGEHVIIVGGTSGIGLAAAQQLVREGADVTIAGRSRERLDEAVAAVEGAVRGDVVDVTDEAQLAAFFSRQGAFTHLVVTASGTHMGSVIESPTAPSHALLETKFWGQYRAAKFAAPYLPPAGSITLFSGTVSQKAMKGAAAYAAAGGAVESLARILALELAPVRVNTVIPGVVDTAAWDSLMDSEQKSRFFADMSATLPVGRVGSADDIASAVVFAVSNGFLNAASIVVDGGHRVI